VAVARARWRLPAAVGVAGFIAIAAAVGSRGPLLSLAIALLVVVSAWLLRCTAQGGSRPRPRGHRPRRGAVRVAPRHVQRATRDDSSRPDRRLPGEHPPPAPRPGDRLIEREPIRGSGAGAFSAVNPTDKWPHNLFLELCSELGLAALVVVAAAIVTPLVGLFRLAWRPPAERREQELVYVLLAVFFNVRIGQVTGDINQNRTF
jgi:hypothetical protein